jgi:glyoxylase-like metal-dependent hydrolase (beta-lactamase superfamily II)
MTDIAPATYAPIPESSLGPALNEQGYHVDRIERNLFWVTDGVYQSAFLATDDGVVLFDAPPTIGHNLRRAVDEITSAEGTTNKVTHLVYSHHHADHAGGASVFSDDVIRIGHEDTRRLLLRENDATRPAPDVTFKENYTLNVGGEVVELSHHGSNHSPDNIFMHFPDHDTMMVVDIVNIGWVPIFNVNLSEDVPGYIAAPDTALSYPWQHYVGGHLGRLGTRADVELHQQYINDIVESSRSALAEVDPTPYYQNAWPNMWAGVKDHLGAVTELATKPVVAKYTGVLAAADVEELTYTTTFMIMQSLRLDYGVGSYVHP